MSDEKPDGCSWKSIETATVETAAVKDQPDKGRKGRGPAPTILQARTGLALANGAPSMASAMRTAGYAESSTKNPTANGVSPAKALQAAAATFPSAPTLRSLRAKSLKAIDEALDDKDQPTLARGQLAGSVVKLAHDVGEDEAEPLTSADFHNARRWKRLMARRALRAGVRLVEKLGSVEAALEAVGAFEAVERSAWPKLAPIDTPRSSWTPGGRS